MEAPNDSPAIKLLRLADNNIAYHGHSHHCCQMRDFVWIAITSGFRFNRDDFILMEKQIFYPGNDFEHFYTAACGEPHPNKSACRALEKYKKRPPYILKQGRPKRGRRIAVGSWFGWQGLRVKCTSFADDGSFIRACSYKEWDGKAPRVDRFFKITHKELRGAK